MKRLVAILIVALVGLWMLVDTVRDFVANSTIQYFAGQPQRLLYVAAIAAAGGLATLGFGKLSSNAQRCVRLIAWGGAAVGLTILFVCMVLLLASGSALLPESDAVGTLLLGAFLCAGATTALWFEFCRAWKLRKAQ